MASCLQSRRSSTDLPAHRTDTNLALDRMAKEVIHPQVPLRIPCYDLAPLAGPGFEFAKKQTLIRTQLAWLDGRCVQGAGAYSPVSYTHLTLPTKA